MKLKKRKWLSLLLCFALILSLMPTAALAAGNVFSGGNGTEASPYEISDLATLEAFREYVNAGSGAGEYFKLTADIDMSEKYGADIGGSEISWTPIGNGIVPFTGNFDGGGHKISGLYINSTSDYQGLFGYVGEGGTVQDLGVDGTVSGSCVGGVVGINNGGTVTSCYNTGDVSGGEAVGGVVGYNGGTVTNCYNTGDVSGSGYVGGVVGYSDGTVTNCYYLTGTADGGINGADAEGGAEAKTAAEFATQSTFVGWDFDGTWSMDNILGRPVLAAIAETDYFSGEGTAESPYLIPDLATLEIFRNYINAYNGAGEYFKLTADIDMSENYGADIGGSEVSWTPIGNGIVPFTGNFDGGGHTISGLYINAPSSDKQGLFGVVGEGGTVQNLGVDGWVIGDYYVGGVVGMNYGTVTSCFNTGDVGGDYYVGGVAGMSNGTVTSCFNTGDVNGSDYVGGVAGRSYSTVTNCYYLTGTANGGIGGTEDSGGESTDKEGSAEAKTAEEFATQSTFVGWDFDTIWQMSDTLKRPTLRSNPENAS